MKLLLGIIILTSFQVAASDFVRGQSANATSQPAATLPLGWPPTLDAKNPTTQSIDGRKIERFVHGPRPEWGYPANAQWSYPVAQESGLAQQNHNSFYLVAPKVPRDNAPLCVILHSANRTAYDYLGYASLNRKIAPSDNPPAVITNSPDDFYALYLNSTNEEWWGWNQARASSDFARHINAATPAELRVLDTIEWVARTYHIDRNRIYLCGVSMGGCGTLAIGLAHGDIFAAARACVPAGTEYAAYRLGGFTPPPASGFGPIDPPVMVDFSSPVDSWSETEPALVQAAQAGHLPLVLGWGPFAHTSDTSIIGKYPLCAVALAFPWLDIRRNEPYPVFTHASTDQPWIYLNGPSKTFASGQMNAWFRWKNHENTRSHVAMQLWIAHSEVSDPSLVMPNSATADVTLRRLPPFEVRPGGTYSWTLARDGHPVASGLIKPDAANLLTIPQLALNAVPAELSIRANP
jgi:predicted esterase